jgi:hypothetical protein
MRISVLSVLAAWLLAGIASAAVPSVDTPALVPAQPATIVGSMERKSLGTFHSESWRVALIDGTKVKEPSPRNAGKRALPIEHGTRTLTVHGLMLHSDVGQLLNLKTTAALTFDADPGTDYVVKGEFGNGFARMWVEDKANGTRVSEVVEAEVEGTNKIWCFGQVACDQIERRNGK